MTLSLDDPRVIELAQQLFDAEPLNGGVRWAILEPGPVRTGWLREAAERLNNARVG